MRAKKKWENFQNCYKNLFSAGQLLWEGSMLNGTKHVKIFLCKQGHVLQKVTTAWLCHDCNRGQKKSEKQCIIVFGIPSPKCEKLLSYQVVNKKR
jgi:hypothetical protein